MGWVQVRFYDDIGRIYWSGPWGLSGTGLGMGPSCVKAEVGWLICQPWIHELHSSHLLEPSHVQSEHKERKKKGGKEEKEKGRRGKDRR